MKTYSIWVRLVNFPLYLQSVYSYTPYIFQSYYIQPTPEDKMAFAALTGQDPAHLQPIALTDQEFDTLQQMLQLPLPCSDGYLEGLKLYGKVAELFLPHNILLFHASAIALDGKAFLFTAPSGTGKSTHARLWRERFGDRVVMINDDKPMLQFCQDGTIQVWGTPFAGKDRLHTNMHAPLQGIVLLHQADENSIQPMTPHQAFPHLFQQTYRDFDHPDDIRHCLDLVDRLSRLPVYSLGCTISQQAVSLAYSALTEETI